MPRKPTALKAGDSVCLVAPSGAYDPDRFEAGVELLSRWDLRPISCGGGSRRRYFAADDAERSREIIEAFTRDDVRGILAVRGGFGAARLRSTLDLASIVARPKLFVGFSDVTILLNRLVQEADMVAYHGPMVAVDLPRMTDAERERFRRFLFGEDGWFDGGVREVWREGETRGRLAGGCLSVLVTTLGTSYEIDTTDTVLFLEDVAEKPYRIDRMLGHLKDAGKLADVRAVVLGPMLDCDAGGGPSVLREIFLDVLGDSDVPVLFGLDAGHGSGNVVLPFGCKVSVSSAGACLDLLEPAFA